MNKCERGHYYDENKFSKCPVCDEDMNKKNIVFAILLVIFALGGVFIGRQSKVADVYENNETNIKKSKNMLSMMLETEANSGNYELTTRESWPTESYVFNSELSKCENGGELSWDDANKIVLMSGNVSDMCYVYFDKLTLGKACRGSVLSNCIKENYYLDKSLNYHSLDLENGAADNSYRYSGGDYILTQKALDEGFMYLQDLGTEDIHNEGVIKFFCDGKKLLVGNICSINGDYYYLIGNDTNNKITSFKKALDKAVELGYLIDVKVNNYVCFGTDEASCPDDNLYRIIGVFNNNIKLVKSLPATRSLLGENGSWAGNDGLINYFWSGVLYESLLRSEGKYLTYFWNNTAASNVWSESNLNTINLNTNYLNNIGDTWSNKIINHKWQVKGNTYQNLVGNPKNVYQNEIKNFDSSTEYVAKVGLMYVSDYLFAVDKKYWSSVYSSVFHYNWWVDPGVGELLITPQSDTSNRVMAVVRGSLTDWYQTNVNPNIIRPTFYLIDSIKLLDGDGTKENPYRLD